MEPSGEVVSALKMACLAHFPVIRLLSWPNPIDCLSRCILALIAVAEELLGLPLSSRAEMRPELCRPVCGVGIFELANGIREINRGTKGESKAFVEPFQSSSTSVDTLPQPNIAPPIFNNIKVLLQARRPGYGPMVERAQLGLHQRPNSIESRIKGGIGCDKGG